MEKEKFYGFLKKIPKTEIHLHTEAIPSRETVAKVLSKKDPKYKDKKAINELFSYDNLSGFIKSFLIIQNAFKDPDDFKKLFSDILPYLKRNGIVHAELFFAPSNFTRNGIEFENMIRVFLKEIESIKKNND